MNELPISALFVALGLLLLLSGFFSSSETALMTINRYRLRNLADRGHRGARFTLRLLERPDRLIGLILLGNNFVNILASSLATIIAIRLGGEAYIAIAAGLLTLVILLFAEVMPKTFAALQPERIAFPFSHLLLPLLWLCFPLVWCTNLITNSLLKLLGIAPEDGANNALSREELRTVVAEAGALIPEDHQQMLMGILDLEKITVEDIMIPRKEISGIDLEDDMDDILIVLRDTPFTRLPVFEGTLDNIKGFVHVRNALHRLMTGTAGELSLEELDGIIRKPHYIPEGTSLHKVLLNFQKNKRRIGLVVDEYGDILGMATMGDVLEEIVGEFTTDPYETFSEIHEQEDGSYLVEGGANVREVNRSTGWNFPLDGSKTINGLVLDYLEDLPVPGTSMQISGHIIEVVQVLDNTIRAVKVYPGSDKATD